MIPLHSQDVYELFSIVVESEARAAMARLGCRMLLGYSIYAARFDGASLHFHCRLCRDHSDSSVKIYDRSRYT